MGAYYVKLTKLPKHFILKTQHLYEKLYRTILKSYSSPLNLPTKMLYENERYLSFHEGRNPKSS